MTFGTYFGGVPGHDVLTERESRELFWSEVQITINKASGLLRKLTKTNYAGHTKLGPGKHLLSTANRAFAETTLNKF